jgi:ATP-binding protein involved in chromosome partitioning
MDATIEGVIAALERVEDPELHRPLKEIAFVRDVSVDGDRAKVTIVTTTPKTPSRAGIEREVRAALAAAGVASVEITFDVEVPTRNILADDPCPSVKNIVLVMSGKGGVGKSTVAANLTLALNQLGLRVGLLDADMYGPSVPMMMGVSGRPGSADGQRFLPLERFGVKLMSIGFLIEDEKSAIVWRGPMLQNALLQFLRDVDWGELDYLVLDMPPGTGDIALTISQKVRTTGAVVVTTPQEIALQDVYKSVSMAQKVGIEVLGVVENESFFICDGCGKKHELFGAGGGARIAEFAGAPLIGQIPLESAVREWGDAGTPVVQAAPESSVARAFVDVARRLAGLASTHDVAREAAGGLRIDRSGGQQRRLPIMR